MNCFFEMYCTNCNNENIDFNENENLNTKNTLLFNYIIIII